jgi:hypothetical protein
MSLESLFSIILEIAVGRQINLGKPLETTRIDFEAVHRMGEPAAHSGMPNCGYSG